MTTLQSFKSKFTVGAKVAFCAAWCPASTVRTVTAVKSGGAAMTHPTRDTSSFLDWPKAVDVSQPEPGLFLVTHPDCGTPNFRPVLVYDFRPEKVAAAKQPTITQP